MEAPKRVLVLEYGDLEELARKLRDELEKVEARLGWGREAVVEDLLADIQARPCDYLRTYRWPIVGGHLLVPEDWLVGQVGGLVALALAGKYRVAEYWGRRWVVMPKPLPKDCVEEFKLITEAVKVAVAKGKWMTYKGDTYLAVPTEVMKQELGVSKRKLAEVLYRWGVVKRRVMVNRKRFYVYLFSIDIL